MPRITHLDVGWYLPKRKRPFAYSTKAAADLIKTLGEKTDKHTPKEILQLINYDKEAKSILTAYIEKGYGDEPMRIR